jgi:Glycosyl transferase family 2
MRVDVACTYGQLPGFLRADGRHDADIPFRPDDEFPFEDGAVEVLAIGDFVWTLARPAAARFLLECRRVLRAAGLVLVATESGDTGFSPEHAAGWRGSAPARDELVALAALVGLPLASPPPPMEAFGLAMLATSNGAGSCAALAFTKPDRQLHGDPLVSILIPAYNPLSFGACLDSALAQSYRNVEIVVGDDSAGTEIEEMVQKRAGRRDIRYERNQTQLRPRANFTRCFERAGGEFIKFLCDDDLLASTCVASLLDTFRQAPDVTLATSWRQRIDAEGNILEDNPSTIPVVEDSAVIAGHTLVNAMYMSGLNTIGEPSTALFRKADLLDQAPDYFRFDGVAARGLIDMVMWSALLLKGNAVYVRECQSAFRNHPDQRQHDPATRERNFASYRSLCTAWLALGVQQWQRPDWLRVKPYPPGPGVDWEELPIIGGTARPGVRRAIA